MVKSKLEHVSHRTAQIIFFGTLILFIVAVSLVALNFFTQGVVTDFLVKYDKTTIVEEIIVDEITIGTAAPVTSLSPLNFEFQNRLVLNNSYEGLVALDPSLQVKQALAVTFGQLDDLTWEFRIREGVKFHNGSDMSPNEVVKSFKEAMQSDTSQLKSVLSNIAEIKAMGGKVQIKTHKPDPTFLNKLATVYIYKDFDNGELYGTGPYKLDSKGEGLEDKNKISLERFEDYWGNLPHFEEAKYIYIKDRDRRLRMFEEQEIDLLRNVPYPLVPEINTDEAIIITQPSLEVTFLGFGFKNLRMFEDPTVAYMVRDAIDREALAASFGGAVRVSPQFVSNGVVGYLPGLEEPEVIIPEDASPYSAPRPLILDFSIGLSEVAKHIESDLEAAGIEVELNPLAGSDLIKRLSSGESDLYLLGWKSEFGDAIDLYKVIAHSKENGMGEFNAGNYSIQRVDDLIAQSDNTFAPLDRVRLLQEIMRTLINEQPFGVPLFETQIIYAATQDLTFTPRIDGYVNVAEVR
ncbi:hypothetical protein HOG48_05915 [Candidatus Peregrinibacteria bacterium]|nr:hypothetical protein [Candidatus Peregrinibacteria bacterium]